MKFRAIILYIILFAGIIWVIVRSYSHRLILQKKRLENIVEDRTREIQYQNDEIIAQRDEIEAQRDEVEAHRDQLEIQRDMVVEQKKEITDSINYAKRIQSAILPSQVFMDDIMPEYFVLFKPKDIVSGDFYWIKEVKNYLIIVAADCTGHGVPGAFMSMLGVTLLNEQVGRSRFDKPGEILNCLRKKVKDTLAQEGKIQEQKDGMDMALAIIDNDSRELQFAGAFNPLYLIRNKEHSEEGKLKSIALLESENYQLYELKGDRQPIAIHSSEKEFTTKQLQLIEGDSIYLFSDGFADQIGGPNGKKFLSRNFRRSLLEIQALSMAEQKKNLDDTLENWRKGFEQVDDILVMGIRI